MRQIECIVSSTEIKEHDVKGEARVYYFQAGNKSLRVNAFPATEMAFSSIRNIPGNPIAGSTTTVYRQAYDTLQKLATEVGKPIYYLFATQTNTMKSWADTSGRVVFEWTSLEELKGILYAEKIFYPQE